MDKSWMYGLRNTRAYIEGVTHFLKFAEENRIRIGENFVVCPCSRCKNVAKFRNAYEFGGHLLSEGFDEGYTKWIWHGEPLITKTSIHQMRDEDDSKKRKNMSDDICEDGDDRIDDLMRDLQEDEIDQSEIFDELFMNSKKPLYDTCTAFSKLTAILKLYNLKAKNNWSDKSFSSLLEILGQMLPKGNELPRSTYEAKKILCQLGLEIERIHACPNDCILYRKQYTNFNVCPKCGVSRYKTKGRLIVDEIKKPPPAKVAWYLPLIPRFKRLFSSPNDAKNLRWHADQRKKDGNLRHPADSPQWRNIDRHFPEFGEETRNLRLGLCTDGMNPHGNMSSRHSTWPVLLVIYNLPPWLCMKRKYIMMSLLISGPKQPGNDIDVYLGPLVDDLKLLWSEGVSVFDAHSHSTFTLHAMLFCTINDFPAYGNLSGYTTKGAKACPICENGMVDLWLKSSRKNVFMNHRVFLPPNHPYRKWKDQFNGKIENGVAPRPLTGSEIYDCIKDINVSFGKTTKPPSGLWKKRSIFWDLPYWEHLAVRHCLDVMHVEKNICDSIIGTLLNIPGKTKDSIKARKDMVEMGIRGELAPKEGDKRTYLPPACFTLSKVEKKSLCECLKSVKVPSGYSSNVSNYVNMKDLKVLGMKSHDFHILMQLLLPVAIRGILPEEVRHAITKLCFFFNSINSKVVNLEQLDSLQSEVIITLCQLEMYFPPSFFDIMVHLVVHLVREIKLCGPTYLRNMFPFEREMGHLKRSMKNRSRPEGSIIEVYAAEEVVEFCTEYLDGVDPIGVPISRHEGRLSGKGTVGHKIIEPTVDLRNKAHFYALHQLTEVHPYLDEHMMILRRENPRKSEAWLSKEHNHTFVEWFKNRVFNQLSQSPGTITELIRNLAYTPKMSVHSYEGYDINGYTFYTKRQDEKSTVQNSGVSLVALSRDLSLNKESSATYYGVINEIWELDYVCLEIPLFLCTWVDNRRGLRVDKYGLTLVDHSRSAYRDEPFILASQARQVFYITDPCNNQWSIVLSGKRHILGVSGVVDEDEYDHVDEPPPFSISANNLLLNAQNVEMAYIRPDHDEGHWIDKH